MNKNEFRVLVQEKISGLSPEQKQQESNIVTRKLITFLSEKKFDTLITYDPLADEVDISEVTRWAEKQGKKVVEVDKKQSSILKFTLGTLHSSYCIVPGRAFTLSGIRLGRGGGFYDQFLSEHCDILKMGVCFSCQVFEELPQDEWDIGMDFIFTGE